MIEVKHIDKSYGVKDILVDVSFSISKGEKIALVGNNGSGKSTLLQILAGLVEPDSGEVSKSPDISLGYMMQDFRPVWDMTVGEYLKRTAGIFELLRDMTELEKFGLENPQSVGKYTELQLKYSQLDGYAFDHKANIMLNGFGLEEKSLSTLIADLSVGQKAKVVIIGLLLKKPELLLLDEPTNNLDIPSIIWLERFLRETDSAMVIVSHDRYFLDKIIKKVIYLDWYTHKIDMTRGTFSDYLERLKKKLERDKRDYESYEEEKNRLMKRADKLRDLADRGSNYVGSDNDKFARGAKRDRASRSGKQAKNLEKRIELMEELEKPIEKQQMQIKIKASKAGGNIQLNELSVGYNANILLGPISLNIPFGRRIGFIGLNGSGKSTLIKSITDNSVILSGEIHQDSRLVIGNFMQQHENMDFELSPITFLQREKNIDQSQIISILTKYGFKLQDCHQKIETLSPGQRARILFALFTLQEVNVLLLDEPTNHLDIEATDALLTMLNQFDGTVILVSHDRFILDKAAIDEIYLVEDGNIQLLPNYSKYLEASQNKAKMLFQSL